MGWSAFSPRGPSISIVPLTTSTTPVQAPAPGEVACANYLVSNTTSQGCFIYATNNAANCIVTIPTGAGTLSGNGTWIPGNSSSVLTLSNNCFFAAICTTGTTTLYIQPGDGL